MKKDMLIYSDVQLHSKVAHSLLEKNDTIFIKFSNLPQNFHQATRHVLLKYLNSSQQNFLSL